ncbi:MAG TPA: DUF6034 family protein [Candidatus Cryosericum sp.]|nr:DUF6034 family protein [Candidatus Cryosericum sp.]
MRGSRVFTLVLCALLLGACQPTPQAMHLTSASPDGAGEREQVRVEKSISLDDGIQLVLSASVDEPTAEFPQGKVEWQPIDSNFVKNVANTFSTDAVFYEAVETQSELTEALLTYQEQLDVVRDRLSPADIQMLKGVIGDMQDAFSTAPEAESIIPIDTVMVEQEAKIQTGNKNKAVLVIGDSNRKKFIRISNYRWNDIMQENNASNAVSEDAAKQLGADVLRELGLSDMFSLSAIRHTSSEYTLVASLANQMGIVNAPADDRVELIYMRNIGGQKQVFSQQIEDGTTAREYDETVFWETIKMYFDNDGLVEFTWQQPCSVTLDSKEIQPIGLETAVSAMTQFMEVSQNRYTYAPLGIDSKKVTVRIDSIELGMTCIVGPDETFLAVPVWEFYGNIEYINDDGNVKYLSVSGSDEGQILDEPTPYNSLCTINALTGKRIDRTLGY